MRVLVSNLEIPEKRALYVPDMIDHTGYTRIHTIAQLQVYKLMFIEKFTDLWLRIDMINSNSQKLIYNIEPGQNNSELWYTWYAEQEIMKQEHGLFERS